MEPLISKRKEGDASCPSKTNTERLSNAAPTSNPSGAAPLPRPLEQEQTFGERCQAEIESQFSHVDIDWQRFDFAEIINVIDSQRAGDAHNTSLRALQEELVAANKLSTGFLAENLALTDQLFAALAACKAKDEALRAIIAVDDQEWSESHKAVVMRDRAKLALQPGSSVKPAQPN